MLDRVKKLPIFDWGKSYNGEVFTADLVAAIIVTIMLIPQSLAYALLAGLPPQMGLYASILPLVAYALFGSSRTLAVGPVAVISLMTAAAVGKLALQGTAEYAAAAILLAFISGVMLLALGLFRMGFLANFLSHPVIAGFITASGIIIATSQLKHIFGVDAHGHNLLDLILSLVAHVGEINWITAAIGIPAALFLFWVRKGLKPLLLKMGVGPRLADILAKTGPVFAVAVSIGIAAFFQLNSQGVALVGSVPQGLPALALPTFDLDLIFALAGSAALISVIGFVESVSVAQTLAAKRRQRIDPDQELVGLGASNIASAFGGGYPVTGGFARSVVNFDAGAQTPAAGAFTAVGIALATFFLTPFLFFLPKAVLAATIIVAVLSLVDFSILSRTWRYSKADFAAVATTMAITLIWGVEFGVTAGVITSIAIHLYKTSKPHTAVVGRVDGTEHFRNVDRHNVITCDEVLSLRVDQSLYFANARFLEDKVYDLVARNKDLKHVILMCPAVNEIDMSALESLEAINERLDNLGVKLHFSEVKGPVMDKLEKSDFLHHLTGKVYLSQYHAYRDLAPHTCMPATTSIAAK
ncbi:SulP family inorganic anion transporter [Maritalea mediterranea]|uniref:Sulfate permease n=1 Tax=Maritalea mediterranea TaxID=2909667 RepID=A0ABS9E528_9HYPH|nr:sulfate permease [Maritalea mediterranea]MCF4097975.1 sulfate permease [Maritalea mediterranea]